MEPVFHCQLCRAKLNLVGDFDPILEDKPMPSTSVRHSTMLHGSVFDAPRIDESFMLLPNDRRHMGTAAAACRTGYTSLCDVHQQLQEGCRTGAWKSRLWW
jgi:hypothetical protein